MAHTRILGILGLELAQHLSFSFSIEENLTDPACTTIRTNDHFRFKVWITNKSAIPLKTLQGTIAPSSLADFTTTPFQLESLGPKKRRLIATLEGRVVSLPKRSVVRFNQIGAVNVSVSADLSRFRLEKSSPLTYLHSA